MTSSGPSNIVPLPRQESLNAASSSILASSTVASGTSSILNGSHDNLASLSLPEQLEILTRKLENARHIEAGAEKVLQKEELRNDADLRGKVVAELAAAKNVIEETQRQIGHLNQVNTLTSKGRKKSDSGASSTPGKPRWVVPPREDLDDRDTIQTALQNASVLVKSLLNIGRPGSSPVFNTTSSSASTSSAHDQQTDRTRIDYMNRLTNAIQRNIRVRYELDASEVVRSIVPGLSDFSSIECRAAAYRVLRHILVGTESVERLRSQNIDWYIIKSLSRDNKHAVEKEQALKLIRSIVEIGSEASGLNHPAGSGTVPLSEAVMRGIIAVAEHPEDPFKSICIQTLIEILLVDIELMARSGGIRTLLHVLADGPPNLAPMISSAFLYIVDSPRTRFYIDPGEEFEIVLSGITDAYGKGSDYAEKMRACTRIVASIFRTWSGLLYFCLHDMAAIRSIINVLRIPELDTRGIVLDFFFDLLNIKTPKWYQTFIDGRRLTMYRRSGTAFEKNEPSVQRPAISLKMRDQYNALLILVFTRAGLLDALTTMLEETANGTSLSRRAVLLMGEVMHLANRLLPSHTAAIIQSAGRVFELASDQDSSMHRIVGTNALSSLDSMNRHRTRLAPPSVKTVRLRANSVEDPVRRGQRQVEQVRIKIGMQMDDRTFQATLLETNVILTKDHTKWNLDVLQDVIEGPLLNHKRMEEAIKVSKFMRKLMSFFHPFNRRFADMPRRGNARWAKLANSLLNTLLASPEGQRYLLNEDPLVKDIVKGFAQLDPHNSSAPQVPLFSKERVEGTMSYSYLEMLGTLSRAREGIEILEKYKVFTAFYHLTELKDRDDLITVIIDALDYSMDGHPRVVLSQALTSHYVPVRLFATDHLGRLIRKSTVPVNWQLRLLVTQMYDPDTTICELAVRFLEELCEDIEVLQTVVEMQPTFEHLGETAHPLLLKAMSTPIGFRYLHDAGYIEREMETWFHERNEVFVVQMEVFLTKAFTSAIDRDEDSRLSEETKPSHFYGELAKTELGCTVLGEKGHFSDFASFIRQYGQETEDTELILKLKSILWAVGNIGATEGGLPFLEDEDIIPDLIRIAEESQVLSIRGTCFFVLGLISSTVQGAEVLADFGWDATLSPLGLSMGICVPADVTKFTMIESWSPKEFSPNERLAPPTDEHEIELMTAIYNLSNTVIANTASRSLARMKSRPEYRRVFSSHAMLYRALHTISTSKYKQPVRRYILDLFDLQLDPETVHNVATAGKRLRAHEINGTQKPIRPNNPRVFSIIRPRRHVDMDEDSDSSGDELGPPPVPAPQKAARTLRPMSRIVGFAQ